MFTSLREHADPNHHPDRLPCRMRHLLKNATDQIQQGDGVDFETNRSNAISNGLFCRRVA
jgi:hypothetical protein